MNEINKNQALSEIKLSITQTLIKEDEQTKKPYTEYVIQIKTEGKKWTINRRYKQFWALHNSLQKNYPTVEFPKSANIFWNKSLSDIRKNAVVDSRRKLLQNYINDVSSIPVIRASSKFNSFLDIHHKEDEKEEILLPRASIEDLFDKLVSNTSKNTLEPHESSIMR